MWLLVIIASLCLTATGQNGDGQAGTGTPPPFTGTIPPTTQSTTTASSTTTPGGEVPCDGDGGTEINFDFKGLLSGSQGGECDCAKNTDCSQCEYGVFGYPCIADPCDRCECGGGLANPPGSVCLPCTDSTKCSDDGSTTSTCLTGRDGVCEPTLEVFRKGIFLGGSTEATDFYLELAFQTQGSLCHYSVSWASSRPVRQVRLFALEHQFGTMRGEPDPGASCFEGIRFKVVNGVNVNYNIVENSLEYDPRFSANGVPGLLYGAGDRNSDIFFGTSSTSSNFRDTSRVCPQGLNGTNLPDSFKVVIEGGGIPSAGLNNIMDASTAPNSDNIGSHWILLNDRGVCVGNEALASQNDGSYIRYAQSGANLTNVGPPIFANPESEFKRSDEGKKIARNGQGSTAQWFGNPYGHSE